MKHIGMLFAFVLLAGCVGPNEGETSIIAFSGPYKQKDKASPGLLYRTISGDESKHDRVVTATSGIVLENEAGDEYEIIIFAGSHGAAYGTHLNYAYVKPGTYHLVGLYLANKYEKEYNGKLCGDMTVTVNPNETVYVGGFATLDGIDVSEDHYTHLVPHFKDEVNADYYVASVKNMYSRPARWHNGKTFRKAIFKNPLKTLPVECMDKFEWY